MMKGFGLALAFALAAVAWQAAPFANPAQDGPTITAGIDGGGDKHSDCVLAESDRLSGCEADELRRITVASIDGSD